MDIINLGKSIKKYRTKCGFTQKELAEKLNLSLQSVVKYERGEREPSFATLNSLSKVFGIELSELVAEDNELISTQAKLRKEMNNTVISLFEDSYEELENHKKELYEKYFFSLLEWRLSNIGEAEEFFKLVLSWCPFEGFKHLTKKDVENMATTFSQIYKMNVYEKFLEDRDSR
ncbi:hypothetical protein GCM10008905_31650 [Clostridium malenominatum]|uniref:HTH cro/C1-type domain-containing protein n=1 Tax=Clostridium malenominatum TaxID=1539 RepID=A0ABN1J6R0_9CLOT